MYGSVALPKRAPPGDSTEAMAAKHGREHWRTRIYQLLHHPRFVFTMISLIFIDILLIVTVLIIESAHPGCAVVQMHCACEPMDMCRETCEPIPESISTLLEYLNAVSMVILMLFLSEVSLHLICVGPRPFLLFDLMVLLISFAIETYIVEEEDVAHTTSSSMEPAQALTIPLLVASRSWRLFLVGHNAFEDAKLLAEIKIDALESEIRELKQALQLQQQSY